MNRIYHLVWSHVGNTWVAVAENTRSRGKSVAGRKSRLGALVLAGGAMLSPVAYAAPTGGQVTAGSGAVIQTAGNTTVNQASQNLSLSWQTFNVGAHEAVNFVQPNTAAIAVNRIADTSASQILGSLNANGQVYLVNPNGIVFGAGAQVNVGGLVASTLAISDSDLASATRHFSGSGAGAIVNRGTITAAPGGYVALLGRQVSNQGAIRAPGGTAALAAGSVVSLSFDANRMLSMQVDQSTLTTLAENKQLIVADGGQVLMSAGAKDSLLASVVNNTGVVQARTVANHNGQIVLLAGMAAGTAEVAGTLDASAPNGGDGGFIETSGAHVHVADAARISTLATNGKTGTWLIDPTDYTIAASGGDITGSTLSNNLGSSSVTILSSQGGAAGSGNINVNDAVSWGANTLTLTAADNININAVMTASGSAGLVLNTATANGADAVVWGGTVNAMLGGRVDFTGGGNTLTINNDSYTIITGLGVQSDATGGAATLQGMAASTNLGGHYALGSNIDASTTSGWNGGAGFTPIGNGTMNFTGTFDGLGHTISGLTENDTAGLNDQGLFGDTGWGSVLRNVGLLGGTLTSIGNHHYGSLVGTNNSTISQAYATGAVSGNSSANYVYVGGLVGMNNGTINQSYATGTVSGGASTYVGGLVGVNEGTINQSYATGTVSNGAYAYAGGLVGYNNSLIMQSYATGAVIGDADAVVGGLVGANEGGIRQSYATGAVSGGEYYAAGGLVGYYLSGSVSASYWDTETTGQSTSAGTGATGLTTAQLEAALPAGFTPSVWGNGGNQTTPYLLGLAGNQVFNANDVPAGPISPANRPNLYGVVLDVNQLQGMAATGNLGGHYALGSNIDASATSTWNSGAGFTPIGNGTMNFTGTFDGLGHTISDLTISYTADLNDLGLFGDTGTASVIRNIGLLGGSLTGANGLYYGSLVGTNNGRISQAYATGVVSSGSFAGAGGLVGLNNGTISQSYATGPVSSGSNGSIGGLVGLNDNGTISQSYATGVVSGGAGAYNAGGLVGFNSGTISQSYATGVVRVGAGAYNVGGLVSNNQGGSITTSYWDTETSGQNASAGGTGLTTAQMMTAASFAGWDLASTGGTTSVWRIYEGYTAPLLRTFMTSVAVAANDVTTTYTGAAYAGSNAYTFGTLTPTFWLPSTNVDANLLLGHANTSTSAINAGGYLLDRGPYSSQMGYDIAFTSGALTIDRAALRVELTGSITKTYDGSDNATLAAGNYSLVGFIGSEGASVNQTAGVYNSKDVTGATQVSATLAAGNFTGTGGTLLSNYVLPTTAIGTASITPVTLGATLAGSIAKTYDGNTNATLGAGNYALTGFISGEGASVNQTAGTYNSKNVTSANSASASLASGNFSATGGTLLSNYILPTTASGAASITPLGITVAATGANKVYDGGTLGAVTLASNGVLAGDTVSFSGVGRFADKNAGESKAVSVTGISARGDDAGNYHLNTTAGTSAAITPATLVYQAASAQSLTGQAPAGLSGSVSGLVGGDTLATATTGALAWTSHATINSPVGSYAIDGGGLAALNYVFTQAPGNATALTVQAGSAPVAVSMTVAGITQGFSQQGSGQGGSGSSDSGSSATGHARFALPGQPGYVAPKLFTVVGPGVRLP